MLCAAHGIELFDGFVERGVDVRIGAVGELADVARRAQHVAVGGGALHHPRVVFRADGGRQFGDELGDVGLPADFVDPASAGRLGGDCDGVDRLAAIPEIDGGDE